jgi:hypothetical protein
MSIGWRWERTWGEWALRWTWDKMANGMLLGGFRGPVNYKLPVLQLLPVHTLLKRGVTQSTCRFRPLSNQRRGPGLVHSYSLGLSQSAAKKRERAFISRGKKHVRLETAAWAACWGLLSQAVCCL